MAAGNLMRAEDYAPFRVEADQLDGRVEVRLVGELDVGTADRLRQAFLKAHDEAGTTIVVDLSRLEFIDSSGLHELVVALKRERASGGDVVLCRPTEQTLRVLEIVGLTRLFTIG